MRFIRAIDGFFFRKISAQGFGLMRILWGGMIFWFLLLQWPDVTQLYSNEGFLTHEAFRHLVGDTSYWNVLDYVHSPLGVRLVYTALLISSFCTMVGISCRLSTIVTFVLYASITERGWLILLGGHAITKSAGLVLMIAPNLQAFSVDRAVRQWRMWKETRKLMAHPSMSIWIWRLHLLQIICIYVAAFWEKTLGLTWMNGSAAAIAMHNTIYSRWPEWLLNIITPYTPLLTGYTMIFEGAWMLLLIPSSWLKKISKGMLDWGIILRALVLSGFVFHLGIELSMDIGHFSITMLTSLAGLLLLRDFDAFRATFNRKWGEKKIHILYDDKCKLCRRTTFMLMMMDFLHRFDMVDFHHVGKRKKVDPHLKLEDLDKAMHIKMPDGKVHKGFKAMRVLTAHIPPLWPLYPLLHLPGISHAGHKTYEIVAHNRRRCTDEYCEI